MGVSTTVEIKNFGKIEYAKVDIKPLTVVVGLNDTGKSFVTRGLYSVLSSFNIDYITYELKDVNNNNKNIKYISSYAIKKQSDIDKLKKITDIFDNFTDLIKLLKINNLKNQFSILTSDKNKKSVDELRNLYSDFEKDLKKRPKVYQNAKLLLSFLDNTIERFSILVEKPEAVYYYKLEQKLKDSLKYNFQTDVKNLINYNKKEQKLSFDLKDIGNLNIENNQLKFSLNPDGIDKIQSFRNIVYVDSPVFVRVKKALENVNIKDEMKSFENKDDFYKGYPKYVDDLYDMIRFDSGVEYEFETLCDMIEEIIGGSVDTNVSGDIVYTQKNTNKSIPINLTAMGIANLGFINLLLRKKVINRGSFLILDEPEVHLHPQWQIKMVEVLNELSKNGVNVVIATHSIDIVKHIEYLALKDDSAKDNIALNLMPFDEVEYNMSLEAKLDKTLEILTEPFTKTFEKCL